MSDEEEVLGEDIVGEEIGDEIDDATVNDEEDMLRMIDIGVDGIMTDYPVQLKELCEKKNINWF